MPDSSPEEIKDVDATKVEPAVVEATDGQEPAASSPAEAKSEKGDMLSAVKAALEPKTEKPLGSDEPGSQSEEDPSKVAEKEGAEAGDDPDDLTEKELSQLRPKTRKRIDNLLRDRSDRDAQIAELSPKAQQFEQITRFVEDAGLSKDEVNRGFDMMKALKTGDHFRAYEMLKPIVSQLATLVGEVLPDDLQQDVNFGRITEARARELATARSRSTITAEQLQRTQQRTQEEQERNTYQANVNDVSTAVSDWERSKEKSDPSWKLKQPRVMELVELEIVRRQRENPRYFPTKAEALEFSNNALKKVDEDYKRLAPRPKAVNPSPDAGSTRAIAAPTNAVEAARQALSASAG